MLYILQENRSKISNDYTFAQRKGYISNVNSQLISFLYYIENFKCIVYCFLRYTFDTEPSL